MIQQVCEVQSCQEVAEKIFRLRFYSEEISNSVKPGQFVNILASENGVGPLLRRPFSVSRIVDNSLDILFHAVGVGTTILSRKRKGDNIDVLGPLGNSFKIDGDYETAIIVAGGIGVAPFPFLSTELIKKGKTIYTLLGFRSSNFKYSSYLKNTQIATDDGSEGFKGNVIQLLEKFFENNKGIKSAKIFACGPTVMLKSLAKHACEKNICCEISLEGQMACGVGICQGCPVEKNNVDMDYALVCKDGPIFLADQIKL